MRSTITIFLMMFFFGAGYGQCWEQVHIEGYEDRWYSDVQFADSLHGWVTFWRFETRPGGILRTRDGGKTWEEMTMFPDFHLPVLTVINKDTVYVHLRPGNKFYYSYDGGDTFDYYELDDISDGGYLYADFWDSKTVWAVGRGRNVYNSKNYGKTWETFTIPWGGGILTESKLPMKIQYGCTE